MKKVFVFIMLFISGLHSHAQEKLTITELTPFAEAWKVNDHSSAEKEYGKLIQKYGDKFLGQIKELHGKNLLPSCVQCQADRESCYATSIMCTCMPCCMQSCDMKYVGCMLGCVIPTISQSIKRNISYEELIPYIKAYQSGNITQMELEVSKLIETHGENLVGMVRGLSSMLPSCDEICSNNWNGCMVSKGCVSDTGVYLYPCGNICTSGWLGCTIGCMIPDIMIIGFLDTPLLN
jgi:hypothetical protein